MRGESILFNATVSFTVDAPSIPVRELFLILPVAVPVASVVVVATGVLVYLKKRRQETRQA